MAWKSDRWASLAERQEFVKLLENELERCLERAWANGFLGDPPDYAFTPEDLRAVRRAVGRSWTQDEWDDAWPDTTEGRKMH